MMLPALLGILLAAQSPDSAARLRLASAVRAARDSAMYARTASAAFRPDLAQASWALVLDRATRVRAACAAAAGALRALDTELGSGDVPFRARTAREAMRRYTSSARASALQCERDFAPPATTPQWADSLRAWGPYRTNRLNDDLGRFIGALHEFAQAAGISEALH